MASWSRREWTESSARLLRGRAEWEQGVEEGVNVPREPQRCGAQGTAGNQVTVLGSWTAQSSKGPAAWHEGVLWPQGLAAASCHPQTAPMSSRKV